jgi:hypothetical protein
VLGNNTDHLKHKLVLIQTVTKMVTEAGETLEPFVHRLVTAPDTALELFHFGSIEIISCATASLASS